jgi:hypothetical protein
MRVALIEQQAARRPSNSSEVSTPWATLLGEVPYAQALCRSLGYATS